MVQLALEVIIETSLSRSVTVLEGVVHRVGQAHALNMVVSGEVGEGLGDTRYCSM